MPPHVLTFEEADGDDVSLLGGKGAGLASMTQQGLPVPPGFIITTQACRHYFETGAPPDGLYSSVAGHLAELERDTGKVFGSGPHPLLVSVRSGAPISMPGMMDTILNLGLGRDAAVALAAETGDTRFVADVVRRFHAMYAEIVLGSIDVPDGVEDALGAITPDADAGAAYDEVWGLCSTALMAELGEAVPSDPRAQLRGAIEAVFGSWNNRRAKTYREFHKIPHTLGTAVVVQSMVFGNLGPDSGSGVAFTRNPVDGSPGLFGEFLPDSQGEDVVSGAFTPEPIAVAAKALPGPFAELERLGAQLEEHRADVLDIEFTIERERLYFLQVRSAKRTAEAAVRIAHDLVVDGRAATGQALRGVTVDHIRQIQRPSFDAEAVGAARDGGRLVTTGVGACPGQVTGVLAFDSDTAEALAADGAEVILARPTTSPADLHGMIASRGIVTATGGSTSHAAVVARALGTACVVGCSDLDIDAEGGVLSCRELTLRTGEEVSLDGSTGELFSGLIASGPSAGRTTHFDQLLTWCAEGAQSEVYARITLPTQAEVARATGADGVVSGLDDILAATGHLDDLIQTLLKHSDIEAVDLDEFESTIAAEVAGLLTAVPDLHVSIRVIDFLADEVREYLQQTPLLTKYPQLSLPLGLPALVEAQCAGLARAMTDSGRTLPMTVAVRHVTNVREAAAIRAIGERVRQRFPEALVSYGGYATSPRSLVRAHEIAEESPISWVELKTLQAGHIGLPPRLLLTQQPLDDYVRAGMLDLDPRSQLDPAIAKLLSGLDPAVTGIRLSLPVTEELTADLSRLGMRRFAVEVNEVRPLVLALGKAALRG